MTNITFEAILTDDQAFADYVRNQFAREWLKAFCADVDWELLGKYEYAEFENWANSREAPGL
jgi:hypothetical protein